MKKSDLHREWARVLDMCEGTKVSPFVCWNRKGYDRLKPARCAPEFSEDPDSYEFAVAIIEDKPVFVGDVVYHKRLYKQIVCDVGQLALVNWREYSWNPPKKTFILNGEELPCPVKIDEQVKHSFSLGVFCHYAFDTQEDCNKVLNAINKLLRDNTK